MKTVLNVIFVILWKDVVAYEFVNGFMVFAMMFLYFSSEFIMLCFKYTLKTNVR